jgi:MFS family permease
MKPKDNLSKDLERTFVGFFKKIFEGYVFIRDNRSILLPFLIMLSVQVVFAMVVVNVPLLAKVILGINPNLAGIYIVVPAGIGAVFGTVYVPRLLKKGLRKKTVIEYSFLILSLMLAFLVFIIPNILQPFKLLVSLLLIIFSGACFIGIIIPSQTSLQEATPGGLRGRVFGNFWFLVTVATIIPVIFSGTISEILGIKFLFFLFSAFALLAYFISRNAGQNVLNNHKSETFNMEDK